jgi:hypothetical protein
MRTQSRDTDLQAERVQIDLLRKASAARRASAAFALSDTAIRLARKAIRLQNAGLNRREALLRFVAIHYGPELADKVNEDLCRRSR